MWVGRRGGNPPASALPARRERAGGPRRGRGTRLPMSRVLRLEDRGLYAGDSGAAGPPAAAAGRAESAPWPPRPRGQGTAAGREGTRVYKQGGGGARRAPGGEGAGVGVSAPGGPVCGLPHPARCRPSRPVQPPPAPAPGPAVLRPPPPPPPPRDPARAAAACRDATPQCISFRTPTGPHCPAACRWGRKAGAQPKT